jgi:hypothetical protein
MVHHPKRDLRDAGGELANLDTEELVDIDARNLLELQIEVAALIERLQKIDFKET